MNEKLKEILHWMLRRIEEGTYAENETHFAIDDLLDAINNLE